MIVSPCIRHSAAKQGWLTLSYSWVWRGLSSSTTVSTEKPKKRKLSVGVIGGGRIATTVHLPNILRNRRLDLKWILDDDPARHHVIKDELLLDDHFPFFTSKDRNKLLDDKSLDGVFVFTPSGSHAELACDIAKRGKPVFVEKPASFKYADVQQMYEVAEKFNVPLFTAYNRRFDQAARDTVNVVRRGDVGNAVTATFITRDSPRPSYEYLTSVADSGCNIWFDLCPHDIDLLVWMTKAARPESIFLKTHAHDQIMVKAGEADSVVATIKYTNGLIAVFMAFYESVYGYDIRFEVFGSEGMVRMENPRLTSSCLETATGLQSSRLNLSFPQRFRDAFEREIQHFVNCMDGTETPLVTKDESLMTTEILEKGLQSFKKNNVVNFDV